MSEFGDTYEERAHNAETAVATLRSRLADAEREARVLVVAMADKCGAPDNWKPLPDAAGMITQISNMVAGLREERAPIVTRAENAEAALVEAESDRDAAFRAHDKAHAACIHYDEMLTVARELLGEAREALRGWSRDDGTTEGDCPCSMCNNTRLNNRIDAHLAGDA
jgi:hypothetical protein